ncbi:ribosomal protein L7/L12 [Chloropicon primus]|nr:ribosomal protein L7/L12 [Chloropicon primus]
MSGGSVYVAQGVLRRARQVYCQLADAKLGSCLPATTALCGTVHQQYHTCHGGVKREGRGGVLEGRGWGTPAKPCLHQSLDLAQRGLCTSSTSAEAKEGQATTIEGEVPNIKYDKNVAKIANQIMQLSLIEVAELTDVLKEKLGINDEIMMQQLGAHYGGPVMAGGAAAGGEAEAAQEEKTAFDVKLEAFDAAKKLKVIKEVRAITGLGLKEAKELVEKAPSDVKIGVSKEEAEEIQKKLEEVGGTIKVE